MKLMLSENIRAFRKQRQLTQEKLAEALGVTVGAVYKWESGLSQPELNLIVEMADFFDTSVDVLLGCRMKDNRLDSMLDRLLDYCRTLDPAALTEAEKALARYPHSFRAVYAGARVYLAFGVGGHDREKLVRAAELMEQACVLLPQNDDPRISEATIGGDLSTIRFLLGEREKSLELLKRNNAGGVFNSEIGSILAVYMDRPEEAAPYLTESLRETVSVLLNTVVGFVFLFRSRNDWSSALDVTTWGLGLLEGLRTEDRPDALEKIHAEMLAMLAYVQAKAGLREASDGSLRKAAGLARRFDSAPDHSLQTMRFADDTEKAVVFDSLGASATESVTDLIGLLKDSDLSGRWREVENEEL